MADFAVFDGHNDLLSRLQAEGDPQGNSFVAGREGALDLAKCAAGGFAGGFFAAWCSNDAATSPPAGAQRRVFQPIDTAAAHSHTAAQLASLIRLTSAHPDAISLCRSAADIRRARAAGSIAALMHIEGCEGIGAGLDELFLYHAAGLRSVGPVWSRPNIFGHGVPFDFPASPDTGPGLTDAGKALVAACNQLRILVDLSHLNEAGFWDVAALSTAPLVATHSNAHAVTRSTRNLTDRQLAAIAETRGLVGVNFGCQFLRPDGIKRSDTPLTDVIRHLDHLLDRLGEGGVALGSDYDGALMPDALQDASRLPALIEAMQKSGYDAPLIRRITWDNWVDLLERTIG